MIVRMCVPDGKAVLTLKAFAKSACAIRARPTQGQQFVREDRNMRASRPM